MSEFIKNGDKIVAKPDGLDYDLVNGKVYNLNYESSGWSSYPYIEEDGTLELPKKIYDTDEFFMRRILDTFNSETMNTGVLLSGLKGSGKSLTAKMLALKSNLPILVVSPAVPSCDLKDFFTEFKTPVCIIFDEIDKNTRTWKTEQMLNFLDGIQNTAKKLVIMTCNETCDLNQYIMDRCSRIKYFKEYEGINKDIITNLVKDILGKDDNELVEYISNSFKIKSYDNIITYLKEILAYPDHDKYDLLNDMNITVKETKKNNDDDE